jgi:hypothetical protein
LKWAIPDYQNKFIPHLGGLHISMNLLKTIGHHMSGSGLAEVWVESGLLGQGTAELALSSKSYNKGMRAHKLTFQALWCLLIPGLLAFSRETDKECHDEISAAISEDNPEKIAEAITLLKHDQVCG